MYSAKFENSAKARVEDVDASFKELVEVCKNIKGMNVDKALNFLDEVIAGKRPVRFYSHNKKMAHRRELGGKKGRYPKKAAKIVKQVLFNALSNARHKNMAEDKLVVVHATANKKRSYARLQPKGRRSRHDYETARVEIILIEKVEVKEVNKENKKEAGKHGNEKH